MRVAALEVGVGSRMVGFWDQKGEPTHSSKDLLDSALEEVCYSYQASDLVAAEGWARADQALAPRPCSRYLD